MAAGSHLEKGICALFVIAAIVSLIITYKDKSDSHINKIFQWPWLILHPILRRIRTSPIRFVRAVIIPAANDLGFW